MRKSSSSVVTVRRFGVWRWAVTALAGAALATLAAWATAMLAAPSADAAPRILAAATALGLGTPLLAFSLVRVEGGVLAFHDGYWTFAPDHPGSVPFPGELAIAVDLGSFPLLTLAGPGFRRRSLPVQRRRLEREWQPLRRAVYSPPLAAAETLAANENPPG
jgi:hypothetical protein